MTEQALTLRLDVHGDADTDAAELEVLTRQLRAELFELDVDDVELVSAGPVPHGAKAGDVISWGTLLVTLAGAGGALPLLITTVQSWLSRHERHTMTLQVGDAKLQLSGATPEERRQAIDAWVLAANRADERPRDTGTPSQPR